MRFRLLPPGVAINVSADVSPEAWQDSVTRGEQFTHEVRTTILRQMTIVVAVSRKNVSKISRFGKLVSNLRGDLVLLLTNTKSILVVAEER